MPSTGSRVGAARDGDQVAAAHLTTEHGETHWLATPSLALAPGFACGAFARSAGSKRTHAGRQSRPHHHHPPRPSRWITMELSDTLTALRLRRRMRSVTAAVVTLLGSFTVSLHFALNKVDCIFMAPLAATSYPMHADCDFPPEGPRGPLGVSMLPPRAALQPTTPVVTMVPLVGSLSDIAQT